MTTEVTALRREHRRSPYEDPCLDSNGSSGSSENLLSPHQRHHQGYHFPHPLLIDFCGCARTGSMTRCVDYGSSTRILATQPLTLVDDHCHHRLSEVIISITPRASRVCAVRPLLPGIFFNLISQLCSSITHG